MTIGRRLVGTITTLVCTSLVLVGCGGNTSPGASDPPADPPAQTSGDPIAVDGQNLVTSPVAGPGTDESVTAGSANLTLLRTDLTAQGNAAHLVWSDDGKSVFLANEEGYMSAVKIDASDPTHPRVAATSRQDNYLWATDQRNGLLVFRSSVGGWTVGVDPTTLQDVWGAGPGPGHDVATDGTRVFVPVEGTPGVLVVLNATGQQTASVTAPDGWIYVFGMAYDAGTRRLYVSSGTDGSTGTPGGVYIFDVSQSTPAYLGKIPNPSSDIAVHGTRLWRQESQTIEAWDVSNPAAPTLIGSYTAAYYDPGTTGGTRVANHYIIPVVNAAGTRLYVTYVSESAGGVQTLNAPAGFEIFDVSNGTPVPVAEESWNTNDQYYEQPLAIALSPDGSTVAVSYWAFGVRFYGVANDTIANEGLVPTTGEAHDVYVDSQGYAYVFAHDDIQVFDPSGNLINAIPIVGYVVDGGWSTFRDGNIIVPGPHATIMKLAGGSLQSQQDLPGFGTTTWSVLFDGATRLYQTDDSGTIHIDQVSLAADGTYSVVELGLIQVPAIASGSNPLLGLALQGSTLWAVGPNTGVVAIDMSNPAAPRIVFRDAFSFSDNGNHAGLVIAQDRVYAGAGALGVRIYNPVTLQQTGAIPGFNINFLDILGTTYLVLANYWYNAHPDGMYLYNIAVNPDAPVLANWFPQPDGDANFRARAVGTNLIYRVPLYGIDILQVH
jgi:hypothetical protein